MGFLNNSARHLSGQSDFFPKSVSGKILHNHTRSLMDLIRLCSHIYALTSTNACVSVWFLWHRAHEAVAAEPSPHPQGCSRQAANQSCVFSFGCSHVPCNFLIPFCFFSILLSLLDWNHRWGVIGTMGTCQCHALPIPLVPAHLLTLTGPGTVPLVPGWVCAMQQTLNGFAWTRSNSHQKCLMVRCPWFMQSLPAVDLWVVRPVNSDPIVSVVEWHKDRVPKKDFYTFSFCISQTDCVLCNEACGVSHVHGAREDHVCTTHRVRQLSSGREVLGKQARSFLCLSPCPHNFFPSGAAGYMQEFVMLMVVSTICVYDKGLLDSLCSAK